MAKTQFNVDQFRTEAVKPLFAVAGATELAVDLARGYATEAQKSAQSRLDAVQARVAKVERDPRVLQGHARDRFSNRLEDLTRDARDAQARFEARVADLQKDARSFPARVQKQLEDAVDELTATYADLATRGEKFVDALRKDGLKAVATRPVKPARTAKPTTAKTTKSTTKKAPAKKTSAQKSAAKKAPAKKPAAKKATTSKATA